MRVELFDRTALAVYTLPKCCDKLSGCCSSVKELLRTIMIKSNFRILYKYIRFLGTYSICLHLQILTNGLNKA